MMITLDDVAGLESHKKILYDTLVLPTQKRELYNELVKYPDKVKIRKNFLFTGPSGTGKTYLANALANTLELPFLLIDAPQLLQELLGRGPRNVRDIYENNKGIIFIDEVDAIARARSIRPDSLTNDVLLQLLVCLDGISSTYTQATIMATNQEVLLDPALLSRVPKQNKLEFSLPDSTQRKLILEKHLSYHQHKIENVDYLVNITEAYDGRQLEDLFSQARLRALHDDRKYLLEGDFYD